VGPSFDDPRNVSRSLLSPERAQVARYPDQRLLGEVPNVGLYPTPIATEGCSQSAYEQVVEVCERLVRVRATQLCKPLFVGTFFHARPILSCFLYHRSTDHAEKQVHRWSQIWLGQRTWMRGKKSAP
jgi:hypothetical protein